MVRDDIPLRSASATPSDAELIQRLAARDISAAGLLYDRYAAGLLHVALRIVRDRSEAEDIVHDAFVVLADRAHQYAASRGTVSAWLGALVRNLSIDSVRRQKRRGTLEREVLSHEPSSPVLDPEARLSAATDGARVRRALAAISCIQSGILETAFFEGRSYREIAVAKRASIGTIKSRAHRALASLRVILSSDDDTRPRH